MALKIAVMVITKTIPRNDLELSLNFLMNQGLLFYYMHRRREWSNFPPLLTMTKCSPTQTGCPLQHQFFNAQTQQMLMSLHFILFMLSFVSLSPSIYILFFLLKCFYMFIYADNMFGPACKMSYFMKYYIFFHVFLNV